MDTGFLETLFGLIGTSAITLWGAWQNAATLRRSGTPPKLPDSPSLERVTGSHAQPPSPAPSAEDAPKAEPLAPEPTLPDVVPSDKARAPVVSLREPMTGARSGFVGRLRTMFATNKPADDTLLEELETLCIGNDIAIETTDKLLEAFQTKGEVDTFEAAVGALREKMLAILEAGRPPETAAGKKPRVILVVGVNGAGKTTTIGKLAKQFKQDGLSVALAAGDTFRAAAIEQLAGWSRRVGCELIQGEEGCDPASLMFDAYKAAANADVLIADTAGRLHTRAPLMDELKKVHKTLTKASDGMPPDEVLLVVDATTGQNGLTQAREFQQAVPLTGVVLTKLDGTAKGGIALSVVDALNIPIRFVGVGERGQDLVPFDPEAFVDALLHEATP